MNFPRRKEIESLNGDIHRTDLGGRPEADPLSPRDANVELGGGDVTGVSRQPRRFGWRLTAESLLYSFQFFFMNIPESRL